MEHQTVAKTVQGEKPAEPRSAVREPKRESSAVAHLMLLHRSVGNRTLGRYLQAKLNVAAPVRTDLLQRKCACGNRTIDGEECAECARKNSLQRKLTISASNDPLEQEADRVADQVLAAPLNAPVSGIPPQVQRFAGRSTGQMDTKSTSVGRVLGSSGRQLEPALKQEMEYRFGYDFSKVRVHTGGAAEQSAHDVSANAYTVGHNIVFGASQFVPETHAGRRLIAHELAHVIQQNERRLIASEFLLQREPDRQLSPRDRQVACVVRRGGCTSGTYGRPGGTAESKIPEYNEICKKEEKTGYTGDPIYPSPDECNNPPKEPLPTGAQILLGSFIVLGAGLAVATTVVAAEAVIPIVVTSIAEAGVASYGFYLANPFVVNEVGLFAAGLLMVCEGNIAGLLQAMATNPEQAATILAQTYILHTTISVNNGPPRSADIPVKLLPQSKQDATSNKIRWQSAGSPRFTDKVEPKAVTSPPASPPSKAAPSPVPGQPTQTKRPSPQATTPRPTRPSAEAPKTTQAPKGAEPPKGQEPPKAAPPKADEPPKTEAPAASTEPKPEPAETPKAETPKPDAEPRPAKPGVAKTGPATNQYPRDLEKEVNEYTIAREQTRQRRDEIAKNASALEAKLDDRIEASRNDTSGLNDESKQVGEQLTRKGSTELKGDARDQLVQRRKAIVAEQRQLIAEREQLQSNKQRVRQAAKAVDDAYVKGVSDSARQGSGHAAVKARAAAKDEVFGKQGEELNTEHILARDIIRQKDDFWKLDRKQQVEVFDLPDTLVVMPSLANSSKGNLRWANWPESKWRQFTNDPRVIQRMIRNEAKVERYIDAYMKWQLGVAEKPQPPALELYSELQLR